MSAAASTAGDPFARARRDPPRPRVHPARLGPYRVDAVVRVDVFGPVYAVTPLGPARAEDGPAQARVLRAPGDPVGAIERLKLEARMGERFDHPAVARIRWAGPGPTTDPERADAAEPSAAVVFDAAPGVPITEFARAAGVAPALRAWRDAASGIAHAHQRGVIHRAIRPACVRVDPSTGAVRVLDFGVARAMGDDIAPVTSAGELLAHPPTMAPEQAGARGVDTRADVYALGALLFEVVSGEPLLPDNAWRAASADAALRAVAGAARAAGDRMGEGAFALALAGVVERALSHDPDDRPATVLELLREVDGALVASARPDRAGPRWRTALVAMALAGALGAAGWAWYRADQRESLVRDRESARQLGDPSARAVDAPEALRLLTVLSERRAGDPTVLAALAEVAAETGHLDRARAAMAEVVALEPTAGRWARVGELNRSAARWQDAATAFDRAAALAEASGASDRATGWWLDAGEAFLAGGYLEPAEQLGQLVAGRGEPRGWSLAARASARAGGASAVGHARSWADAFPDDPDAWAALGKAIVAIEVGGPSSQAPLSQAPWSESAARAAGAFERAIELDPGNADRFEPLAALCVRTGRWGEARAVGDRWVVRWPSDPRGHRLVARAASREGDLAAASSSFERAATLANGSLGVDPASMWHELGVVELARGERESAAEAFERAVELDPGRATTWFELGRVRAGQGDHDAASDAFAEATDRSPSWLPAWLELASSLIEAGRIGAAGTAIDEADRLCSGCAPVQRLRERVP